MRILGIDPGIATVGFGAVDAEGSRMKYVTCGVVTTPAHTPLSERLDQIYTDLEELLFDKNITTGISVAHGRGVILLAAYRHGIPVYEYTPMQVKQAVVGYGLAKKAQVIDMVRRLLSMPAPPKPDDAADAVAVAICHARSATSLLTRANTKADGEADACSTI